MSNVNDEVQALSNFIDSKHNDLFTQIPAKVTDVSMVTEGKPFINAEPLINTKRSDGTYYELAEVLEVPLMVYSANNGKAKFTLPIKVGDNVLLIYSMRDTEDYLTKDRTAVANAEYLQVLGEYPIMAIPAGYTQSNYVEVDPDNILIENDILKVVMKPDGEMTTDNDVTNITHQADGTSTYSNDKVNVEYNNDGTVTITNGTATVTLESGGNIVANTSGNITATAGGNADVTASAITLNGPVTINGTLNVTGATTAAAITGAAILGTSVATTGGVNLDSFKSDYDTHTHISNGSGNETDPPS
jgi:hypothetical protein